MCVFGLGAALTGLVGAGGAAAAGGATAAASTLTTLGTIVSVGGSLLSGIQRAQAAKAEGQAIAQQAETEARISATQDQRERQQFMAAIAKQRAELAARGVSLDSVTAIALGQTAAQEMAFQSQATRQGGAARTAELSSAARAKRYERTGSVLRGVFSAADGLLTAAPDLWPSLKGAA